MKARNFHHNVFSYLRERRLHLRSDIDLDLLDAAYDQFAEFTKPGASRSVGYPIILMRYEDTLRDSCMLKICSRLGTCKNYQHSWTATAAGESTTAASRPRVRKTNSSSPCVIALNKRLGDTQRAKVETMRNFRGSCMITLPSDPAPSGL